MWVAHYFTVRVVHLRVHTVHLPKKVLVNTRKLHGLN